MNVLRCEICLNIYTFLIATYSNNAKFLEVKVMQLKKDSSIHFCLNHKPPTLTQITRRRGRIANNCLCNRFVPPHLLVSLIPPSGGVDLPLILPPGRAHPCLSRRVGIHDEAVYLHRPFTRYSRSIERVPGPGNPRK